MTIAEQLNPHQKKVMGEVLDCCASVLRNPPAHTSPKMLIAGLLCAAIAVYRKSDDDKQRGVDFLSELLCDFYQVFEHYHP